MLFSILLVDDHEIVRKALRSWLEVKYPHVRVYEVASGEEAIAFVRSESPSLVLMDITMPGIDGIQATQQIKDISPATQVMMLTIHNDTVYRDYASAAGASAYVAKQAINRDLIPALSRILANAQDQELTGFPQNKLNRSPSKGGSYDLT